MGEAGRNSGLFPCRDCPLLVAWPYLQGGDRTVAIEPYRTFSRRGIDQLVPWAIAAIATSGLYFGRLVLIPIILAVLLSFYLPQSTQACVERNCFCRRLWC